MYKEITLKDPYGNKKKVPMLANAATPIRFKMLFHADILKGIIGSDGEIDFNIVSKLAYLMNGQALGKVQTLNDDDYISWLEQFDSAAFMDNMMDIFGVYRESEENSSKPKN